MTKDKPGGALGYLTTNLFVYSHSMIVWILGFVLFYFCF